MSQQQMLLKRELTVSQILREYGKMFTQITERYSDGGNGRCAVGVIMSYFDWNGKDDGNAERSLTATSIALGRAGVSKESLKEMNDCGLTFEQLANYLDLGLFKLE
jgi:hypothetical protein